MPIARERHDDRGRAGAGAAGYRKQKERCDDAAEKRAARTTQMARRVPAIAVIAERDLFFLMLC